MKLTVLHKGSGTSRLLLIAAGWGTDASFYSHVAMPGWDTAVVTMDTAGKSPSDITAALAGYKTIYLYAWSLGVRMAELLHEAGLSPTASFAIAGTGCPISDSEGIPAEIFTATESGLDEPNLIRFRRRMCGGAAAYRASAARFPVPSPDHIAELRAQLRAIAALSSKDSMRWTRAYITAADNIFPAAAQAAHWERRGIPAETLESPHLIDIQHIVTATVVNIPLAARRFARRLNTYSAHARAQRLIATRLASSTADTIGKRRLDNMLEIGCGSGELSRALGNLLEIDEATFIDLYRCEPFGVAGRETYVIGDAETVVENFQEASFSLICASSAIQWFSDLRRFARNCRRLLAPEGVLALSTFACGNLAELDPYRRSSIGYLSVEEIEDIFSEAIPQVSVRAEEIALHFPSVREMLRHLQLTGVTASGADPMPPGALRRLIQEYPCRSDGSCTLTFRPVYILARR